MSETIHDADLLLRRVQYLNPNFIKDDGSSASSSFSLKSGEHGLSVDVERLTTHSHAIQDRSRFRLYALIARQARSLGLEPVHDPIKANYAHCLIQGNISRSVARNLAKSAIRIGYPE